MTQYFDENGRAWPATVLEAGPARVTQVKTKEKDGYAAVQIGLGEKKKSGKALRGHFGGKVPQTAREFRLPEEALGGLEKGQSIGVSAFAPGDKVAVSGISKGKGFQGVVKRHGFHGGPRSHGQKHSEREPGSIGATGPQRVFKGKKMAGRMGADRVTVKGLKVLAVDSEKNEMIVSGAVPGRRGTLLEVKSV